MTSIRRCRTDGAMKGLRTVLVTRCPRRVPSFDLPCWVPVAATPSSLLVSGGQDVTELVVHLV